MQVKCDKQGAGRVCEWSTFQHSACLGEFYPKCEQQRRKINFVIKGKVKNMEDEEKVYQSVGNALTCALLCLDKFLVDHRVMAC